MNSKPSVILQCESLYKIFGENPKKFFKQNGGVVDEQLFRKKDYIVAVNNISLKVYQGEILVIMGLSGSGKSTLLRCISRLVESTAGSVTFEGKDLLAMNSRQLIELRRHKMGMVFQNFALLPHKTVFQNIIFPLQIRDNNTAKNVTRTQEMINLVGLQGRENNFPRELSGGQQQRVGIARSLAVEPDVWFLDEPFSALDPLIRREMQDEFLQLQSMLNKTIIFITHDFSEALRLADRVAIMYNGNIEQIGTPADIVLHPATEYVKKFTKEVPKEKVLTVATVMDKIIRGEKVSSQKVFQDDLIEKVAEKVFLSDKPILVLNSKKEIVGTLHHKNVASIIFGQQ